MIPEFFHPVLKAPIRELLQRAMSHRPTDEPPMQKVIPFPKFPVPPISRDLIPGFIHPVPPTTVYWTIAAPRKTYIMATLNATPDSFSDGSVNNSLAAAISYANNSVTAGADIIDIGGYSTRPGAAFVSEEEEIQRVVPIIESIRSLGSDSSAHPKTKDVLISVDTFRWGVAEAAVLAGVNCINDVYAFTGPGYPLDQASVEHLTKMRKIARDLSVPIVLMHSRGDAGSNKSYQDYNYAADAAVLEGIRMELGAKVDAIVKGKNGIRRWLVMVDPGVGFSKTRDDNLKVLRHASLITKAPEKAPENDNKPYNPLAGYPQLIGASRKSFLGAILSEADGQGTYEGRTTEAKERGWATAAAVACAVQQGAVVVRVHDVLEMGDVVRVSSALWD